MLRLMFIMMIIIAFLLPGSCLSVISCLSATLLAQILLSLKSATQILYIT